MEEIGKEVATGIYVIENAIDNCKEILEIAEKKEDSWASGSVFGDGNGLVVNKDRRNADTLDVSAGFDKEVEFFTLSQKIWQYGDFYGKKYKTPFSDMEGLQMLRYEKDSEHYDPHIDTHRLHPRIFSAVLYLNDVESGGETYFERFDVSVKPKEGRLVIFPANFIYMHSALPPKSGRKFAVVTWFTP